MGFYIPPTLKRLTLSPELGMERIEAEIRHFRHEAEIERLKNEVRYLSRMSKAGWLLTPIVLALMFGFFLQRDGMPRGFMRFGGEEEPFTDLSASGLDISGGLRQHAQISHYPTPGITLRDGAYPYRIAVVRGKLVAESTDRHGKPIVKVRLDNGDADR